MATETSGADLISAISSVLQALFIAVGGVWVLFVYFRTRRGQVRVGIEASFRLVPEWNPGRTLLLVRLRIANTSNVLYHHREATATLMDARGETDSGLARLIPFEQTDPLAAVYGDFSDDPALIREGRLFTFDPSGVSLEPGEHVESETSFVLDSERLGLMALRVLLRGRQRRLFPRDYWWGTFTYVVPTLEPVSLEPNATQERTR